VTTPVKSYTHRIFDSIEKADLRDWQRVCHECDDPVFMDVRLIGAVEAGLRRDCEFWHVLVYDEENVPVACASLSTVTIDLANLAHPRVARVIRQFPRVLSKFRTLKLFLCGLPVSAGQSSLAMVPTCDKTQVLSVLDRVVSELALQTRSQTVVYKEFGGTELESMKSLFALGYRQIPSLPMHSLRGSFENFEEYCSALRSHYRYKVQRSARKLQRADIQTRVLTDTSEILSAYTAEVHRLYHQVLERSETRVETLTVEFFHELTRRRPGDVDLVVLARENSIVAFAWSLRSGSACHLLFVGLDYALNEEYDLYFNLLYAWMDCAFRSRASTIKVGQTTDAFKARLGCYSEPLFVFMKGIGPVMSAANRLLASLAVSRESPNAALHVFKTDEE